MQFRTFALKLIENLLTQKTRLTTLHKSLFQFFFLNLFKTTPNKVGSKKKNYVIFFPRSQKNIKKAIVPFSQEI